jgi:regulator of nucleoside diphosphate kinase
MAKKAIKQPRIRVTRSDYDTLEKMIGDTSARSVGVEILDQELGRAVIVNDDFDGVFCRLGSWVSYQDLDSGQTREIQIVVPALADIDQGRVSVLSQVGASLLGLSPGAEFGWTDATGRPHRVKTLAVMERADAAV